MTRIRKHYLIEVSAEDINSAVRNSSYHCAVSTAVARTVGNVAHVQTDIQTIRFSLLQERRRLIFMTPRSVQQYVVDFDAGKKLEPFSFTLTHPAWIAPMRVASNQHISSIAQVRHSINGSGDGGATNKPKHLPPAMGSSSRRSYGLRGLRINQPDDKPLKE